MDNRPIVSRQEWLAARTALLAEEKALDKARDALAARRRDLPMVRLDRTYRFDGPDGPLTLEDLFGDASQLIVHHFMFGEGWEAGCTLCTFWADQYDRAIPHLAQRDTALAGVASAPAATLSAYKDRLGWTFPLVSAGDSRFGQDFHATFDAPGNVTYNYRQVEMSMTEAPAFSVFFRPEPGVILHSYSTYARGLDMLNAVYHLLDLTPKGRDEQDLPFSMGWVKRRYEM